MARSEIRRLRQELDRLPPPVRDVPAKVRAVEAQRSVDGLEALAGGARRDRAHAARDVAWLESETAGFEKALLLVSTTNDADGRARLERRLGERQARLESARQDLERLDARVAEIEAGVADVESELVSALAAWLDEAQQIWVAMGRPTTVGGIRAAAGARAGGSRTPARPVKPAAEPLPEMWSPTAVLGYRMWAVARDGLTGAWRTWRSSRMTADCAVKGEVPHTDGRCARVAFGCGVYAATSASALMKEAGFPDGLAYAVGLVGLEGKVVQHERGYRAEHATVLALAVVNTARTRVETLDDPVSVAAFFASKGADSADRPILPVGNTIWGRRAGIEAFLQEQTWRFETWTSASRPA